MSFGLDYANQIWVYRVLVWVLPVVVFFVARRICRGLQEAERVEETREEAEAEGRLAAR